jgi:protein-S-isoprenylcysteine O-methyltransferase Ste14
MLQNELVSQGNWLFRWRSYLPFIILPLAATAFSNSLWVNETFGNTFEEGWDYACYALALCGLLLRILTVAYVPAGTSGRNTTKQKAEVLNTTGMYSVVRHPLYFANFVVFIAFVLLFKSLILTLFMALAYFLYYERIMMAEESFLHEKYGDAYRTWASKTPAFFPRLTGYVVPSLSFSWRSVVVREHHTLLLITVAFAVVEMLEALVLEQLSFVIWVMEEPVWPVAVLFTAFIYLFVRMLRKRTRLLKQAGR